MGRAERRGGEPRRDAERETAEQQVDVGVPRAAPQHRDRRAAGVRAADAEVEVEEDPLEPVRDVEHDVDDRRQHDERDGRVEQAADEEGEQDRIVTGGRDRYRRHIAGYQHGVGSEVGRLRTVVLHRPGPELRAADPAQQRRPAVRRRAVARPRAGGARPVRRDAARARRRGALPARAAGRGARRSRGARAAARQRAAPRPDRPGARPGAARAPRPAARRRPRATS